MTGATVVAGRAAQRPWRALAWSALLFACVDASAGTEATVAACTGSGVQVWLDPAEGEYRCDLVRKFAEHGADLSGSTGAALLTELRRRYATRLQLAGTADLSRASIRLLLDELPDTARLINIYKDTRYEIRYLDETRDRFSATNNRNMSAVFTRFDTIYADDNSRYLLYENGEAKFLFWRFRGSAFVELELRRSGSETDYLASLHIFTDSRRYHSFFQSGLFRYIVKSVVVRIIGDIVSAANSLIESDSEMPSLTPSFTKRLRLSAR